MAVRGCVRCGAEFVPHPSGVPQKYCGKTCRDRRKTKPFRQARCAHCSAEFAISRAGHRYCTEVCRAAAWIAKADPERRAAQWRAASRRWARRHPDRVKATQFRWRAANPERAKAARKNWKMRNRARVVAHERSRQQRRPEVIRAQKRRLMYGITAAAYEAKFQAQGNVCAICGTDKPTKKGWAVDHCHATGVFRGVLCGRCNPGLGLFSDDVDRLRAAIAYLLKSMEQVA